MEERISSPWIQLETKIWEELFGKSHEIEVAGKTSLFHQGEVIRHIYIVKSGRILITALSPSGMERILLFALGGCVIGEQILFFNSPMTFAARTVAKSRLYKVPVDDFRQALEREPALALQLVNVQVCKEKALTDNIVNIYFEDAFKRAVRELLHSAYVHGEKTPEGTLVKIPISQEQLGKRIQASRVTVNKIHKQLSDEGLIGRRGLYYLLYDIPALEKIISE